MALFLEFGVYHAFALAGRQCDCIHMSEFCLSGPDFRAREDQPATVKPKEQPEQQGYHQCQGLGHLRPKVESTAWAH